ncbi:MAG: hypothetical protein JST50_12135 [Bacteroidetes bacterium]|jgi:hypothetical protein|nr:hypothetical protein [Bacteroidota bacterium]
MSKDLEVEKMAFDITGQINNGLPITIVAINDNSVDVHWFEGEELVAKNATVSKNTLRALS